MYERDFERAIIKHIQRFLLELGKGFAYVGNQFNVKVDGDEYALDLLFFNYNLNCFVVFELKAGDFKSEYAGKLNFYVNVIDAQIKMPEHNQTIGVLLCKTPNKTVVKYALQGIQTPLGVSEYELMPTQLKAEMPTIEELEKELDKEIKAGWKPFEEKKSKLKDILTRVKGREIKNPKEASHILYLYEEVLLPLLNRFKNILKSELELFAKKEINFRINETTSPFFTLNDIQTRLQNKEDLWRLGLSANFDGFKPAGIKAFNVSTELIIELRDYKYELSIPDVNMNHERLYHFTWVREDLERIAEQWGEYVLDEINQRLESALQ
jgi:hypothetical protein